MSGSSCGSGKPVYRLWILNCYLMTSGLFICSWAGGLAAAGGGRRHLAASLRLSIVVSPYRGRLASAQLGLPDYRCILAENRLIQETLGRIYVALGNLWRNKGVSRNTWWNVGGFREHLAKYIYKVSGNSWQNKERFTEHLVEYRRIQGTLEEYRWMKGKLAKFKWIQGTLGGINGDSRNTWRNKWGFMEHIVEYRWIQGTRRNMEANQ